MSEDSTDLTTDEVRDQKVFKLMDEEDAKRDAVLKAGEDLTRAENTLLALQDQTDNRTVKSLIRSARGIARQRQTDPDAGLVPITTGDIDSAVDYFNKDARGSVDMSDSDRESFADALNILQEQNAGIDFLDSDQH